MWSKWSKRLRTGALFQAACLGFLAFLTFDACNPVETDVPWSRVVQDRNGEILQAFLSADDKWRLAADLHEVTGDWVRAMIAKEDRFFYRHPGVNPLAVARAAFNNAVRGYRTSGASTITMQTVKLLEPRPRTLTSKAVEAVRALQLEWRYSKREILQLYVNLLPYGGNIEGVKSASLLYFGKMPQQLSLDEIALLTVIPNDPERYKFGADQAAAKRRRDQVLRQFARRGVFPADVVGNALLSETPGRRRALPVRAPHFSRLMRHARGPANLRTSLDLNMQVAAEGIVESHMHQMRRLDVHNAAVLVIDNLDGSVLAWVGSQDFSDMEHAGQVDGVLAVRSPGSTLKPLIYALAFEKGLLTPGSVLLDLPVNFQGYQPENYDETFRGKVTAGDALAQSLNVPAVKTLHEVGVSDMVSLLSGADFGWIARNKSNLGLSLALGGCGASLQELTGIYAMLARQGIWKPLRKTVTGGHYGADTLLSAGACYFVHESLRTIERPDLPGEDRAIRDRAGLVWKTGTSYGRRDAWAIGYNSGYSVGVWVGNFNGKGVPELSGAEAATPLLLRIFGSLPPVQSGYSLPKDASTRFVCAETGLPPGPFCENQVPDLFLPGLSPGTPCDHLVPVWTDSTARYAYCPFCMEERPVQRAFYPNLPGELVSWYEKNALEYREIPPHFPDCVHFFASDRPVIVHPIEGATYYPDPQGGDEIILRATAASDVRGVYWYYGDRMIGYAKKDDPFFYPVPVGPATVTCVDDKGRRASVSFTVGRF